MKRGVFDDLTTSDHYLRTLDDNLVHIVVEVSPNNDDPDMRWCRNCDIQFIKDVLVDRTQELVVTCLWCVVERSDRFTSHTWL